MTVVTPESRVIEPGGIEAIPAAKRHGSPWTLLGTWSSPNLEFATVFVGFIGVAYFGLDFWSAVLAVAIGNALGGLTQGVLSTWGPREGLAQLVLSRTAFGLRGNILPAGLNTIMAGLGWFATNSVSGAFALTTLTQGAVPPWASLVIAVVLQVLVAFIGHDLVQRFERYAAIVLAIIFLIATVIILSNFSSSGVAPQGAGFNFGGFTLTLSAAFGYAAGWNPYAADYTRYLPKSSSRALIGWAAGLGIFLSCTVLMIAGAASAYLLTGVPAGATPTDGFVFTLPTWSADLTLIAIAVGAIAANALNIYSGAMSFLAAGVKLRFGLRRAIIAIGFGILGFVIALVAVLNGAFAEEYENFLLVIAYWIAPWLGVVLVDRLLRRGTSIAELVPEGARYRNWAGFVAFLVAMVVSVLLFSNQVFFTGYVVQAAPTIGDLTPIVGFVLAGLLYWALFVAFRVRLGGPFVEDEVVVGVDAAEDGVGSRA